MAKKQDSYFFNNFVESAEYACEAAVLLGKIIRDFDIDKISEYTDKMHAIENAGDEKKHEMMSALIKTFITPIDREDIASVSQNIDELTDMLEDVLIRIYYHKVCKIRPDAIALADVVFKCCKEVVAMLKEFSNFKKSKELENHIKAINSLEEDADRLYIECMYNLHDLSIDIREILAWTDIYNYLEKCADTTEHIADIVESVAMKNS